VIPGNVRVIEILSTFTPLGIRFWDSVLDAQVRDGLHVTARPFSAATTRPRATAYRTGSDIYAFGHLSGLEDFENGRLDPLEESSPSRRRPFIVEVSDTQGRYLDVAFQTDLPLAYRGLFLTGELSSPLLSAPPGFFLYSAPSRIPPAWLASVRGQLLDATTGTAAAYALVQVEDPDGNQWFGISDAAGMFVVLLPYPTIAGGFVGSPLIGGEAPLHTRTWDLQISVRYSPDSLERLPFTGVPDYYSILSQVGGSVWPLNPSEGGASVPARTAALEYGRTLTIRTEGLSELLVSPEPTSP
jgi:hypothetical protein